MTADRTAHLTAATRRRVTDTRDRATAALPRLDHEGTTINYVTVAKAAGVSRALLYRDPKLREEINRLRDHHQSSVPRQPTAQPAVTPFDGHLTRENVHHGVACELVERGFHVGTLDRWS